MVEDRYEAYRSMYVISKITEELKNVPSEDISTLIYDCIITALESESKSPQLVFNNVIKRYSNVRKG
jgi:hypothetical protein